MIILRWLLVWCFVMLPQMALAQPMKDAEEHVKAELDGWGSLEFQRLTTEGQFQGCELSYKYLFRDFRAHNGELVSAYGVIASYYAPGKVFNVSLKVQTAVVPVTLGKSPPQKFQPAFARLSLEKPLDAFKAVQFTCDGGLCIAYGDSKDLELMKAAINEFLAPGPTITVTTSKGGIDQHFSLLKLTQGNSQQATVNAKAHVAFYECLGEILGHMRQGLGTK